MSANAPTGDDSAGSDAEGVESDGVDPTDTDHPTGSKQAAENAADESPS
jgi:hypothetical protein